MDIIVINPVEFYNNKRQDFTINLRLKEKFDSIQIYNKYVNNKQSSYHKNAKFCKRNNIIVKCYKKELISLLNKLNISNYNSIITQIKSITTIDNVAYIVNTILTNIPNDKSYIKCYIDVIIDLKNDNNYTEIINDLIEEYFNTSIENINNVVDDLTILFNSVDYNDFCMFNKKKNNLINTTIVIAMFLKTNITCIFDSEEYIDILIFNLLENLDGKYIEVIIDMLRVFTNEYNNYTNLIKIRNLLSKSIKSKLSIKCQYKLENIVSNIKNEK